MEIWTIGHSNRTFPEFLELVQSQEIDLVADVRRFPGSRRFPHFGQEALQKSLTDEGLQYRHFLELGGRRATSSSSRNTAWRNAAFRGYADYMETPEFRSGMNQLCDVASKQRTVVMCAEACWWQCHRSLIADFFKVSGHKVWHIMDANKVEEHPYTSAATVNGSELSYAAPDELPFT